MELKCKALNEEQGTLTGYDCQKCMNRGYIAVARGEELVMRDCECKSIRKTLRMIEKSGLSGLISRYTWDSFQTPDMWHMHAKENARLYTQNPDGKWFMISGTPGTGKTHLCTAMAGEFIHTGKNVRYMLWREDVPRLKATVNDREYYERVMNEYKTAEVLYIDDFFKGTVSDADINLAFELLNARYNAENAVTILSSELSIDRILNVDEAVGSRIYERSKENYLVTPDINWRIAE